MNRRSFWKSLFTIALLSLLVIPGQTQSVDEGRSLFRTNCGVCHSRDMKSDLTGPALAGVEERWSEYPREDLYTWIRSSQRMIQEGHPRAVELWDQYQPNIMQDFANLTDEQIESILAYIDAEASGALATSEGSQAAGEQVALQEDNDTWLYYVLFFVLAILAIILGRLITRLNQIQATDEGKTPKKTTVVDWLTSRTVIGFVVFALVIFAGYTTVNNGIALGRQQGYEPEQPIKFSHATHAGLHQIDCQYCHDGARRSKHSIIPAMNTCMNCHSAIKSGSLDNTAEITKIFAAVGYDPSTNQYIENYEQLEEDEIESIFKKWIGDQYLVRETKTSLDLDGRQIVDDQWNALKEALTNETKTRIQGPVEWVRIHNLPDHVFFSHAQHVTVGEITCQECHGKIEEMDVVKQYAPLSMGWCINCHRETEVTSFGDNNYYLESYKQYHEELESGSRGKITVEDIGGLECQKCHY